MRQSGGADKLERGCAQLGLRLAPAQLAQLRRHLDLLAKWNRRMNLTAVRGYEDGVARHLLDSLAIAPFVGGGAVLDIGSGGGFPGAPLAVALPRAEVTLLDGNARRIAFLRQLCAALGRANLSVAHARAQDYRPRRKFDTLVTRAFAPLGPTLRVTAALQSPGARLLAMKGPRAAREVAALAPAWRARARVETLQVPFLSAGRRLIIIEF